MLGKKASSAWLLGLLREEGTSNVSIDSQPYPARRGLPGIGRRQRVTGPSGLGLGMLGRVVFPVLVLPLVLHPVLRELLHSVLLHIVLLHVMLVLRVLL